MENLSIEERKEMILKLAGDDISVILNTKFNSRLNIDTADNIIISGNTIINSNLDTPGISNPN